MNSTERAQMIENLRIQLADDAASQAQHDAWHARHNYRSDRAPSSWALVQVDHIEALTENIRRAMGDEWAKRTAESLAPEVTCPDECPRCGVNLAADGYPVGHQDADTGEVCSFRWATGAIV